jgi:cell division protein FtsN
MVLHQQVGQCPQLAGRPEEDVQVIMPARTEITEEPAPASPSAWYARQR